MAPYSCIVLIERLNLICEKEVKEMDSTNLVPGDLFEIQKMIFLLLVIYFLLIVLLLLRKVY